MLWTFHRHKEVASLLACISLVNNLSESFVPTATRPSLNFKESSPTFFISSQHGNNVIRAKISLDAKPKKKKKGGSAGSSGGGFGKVQAVSTKPKSKVVDDYASFPRLEPGVIETLIPSTPELMDGDITMEIYDRLDQIYDFPYFNVDSEPEVYTTKDDTNNNNDDESSTSSPMSMNDLLSVNDEKESSSSSGFGDLLGSPATGDFDDLIAAAASGKDTTATATTKEVTKKKVTSEKLNLYNLNPFEKMKVLHIDPLVITVEDFLTDEECDRLVNLCANPKKHTSNENMPMMISSKTVGKDAICK